MNHRGKEGRNHEYQDSNDSDSTPDCRVLQGIRGGGVPPGSPNSIPILDHKMSLFTPVFRPGARLSKGQANFRGPISNIQIEIKRIRARVLAQKTTPFCFIN